MKNYKKLLDFNNIPKHIGIIMDGNGRWAKERSLPRSEGHKRGSEIIEPVINGCIELGVRVVSLYAFSLENWARPKNEVAYLWTLFEHFFNAHLETLIHRGIKVIHSGQNSKLPAKVRKSFADVIDKTSRNKTLILNLCVNYGGRQEIVEAVNRWLDQRSSGEKLTLKKIDNHLYTAGLPEPDLIIRTSGEYRISNFMLWQLAYSEFSFVDVLWPDFTPAHLHGAIYDYQQRERRFGNI